MLGMKRGFKRCDWLIKKHIVLTWVKWLLGHRMQMFEQMFILIRKKHTVQMVVIVCWCPNYCLDSVFLDKQKFQFNRSNQSNSPTENLSTAEPPTPETDIAVDSRSRERTCHVFKNPFPWFRSTLPMSLHVFLVGGTKTQVKEMWMQIRELRWTNPPWLCVVVPIACLCGSFVLTN